MKPLTDFEQLYAERVARDTWAPLWLTLWLTKVDAAARRRLGVCTIEDSPWRIKREGRNPTRAIQVQKVWWGWTVNARWCPTTHVRDAEIRRCRNRAGEHLPVRTPG